MPMKNVGFKQCLYSFINFLFCWKVLYTFPSKQKQFRRIKWTLLCLSAKWGSWLLSLGSKEKKDYFWELVLRTGSSQKFLTICLFWLVLTTVGTVCLLHVKKDTIRSGKEDELGPSKVWNTVQEEVQNLNFLVCKKQGRYKRRLQNHTKRWELTE